VHTFRGPNPTPTVLRKVLQHHAALIIRTSVCLHDINSATPCRHTDKKSQEGQISKLRPDGHTRATRAMLSNCQCCAVSLRTCLIPFLEKPSAHHRESLRTFHLNRDRVHIHERGRCQTWNQDQIRLLAIWTRLVENFAHALGT